MRNNNQGGFAQISANTIHNHQHTNNNNNNGVGGNVMMMMNQNGNNNGMTMMSNSQINNNQQYIQQQQQQQYMMNQQQQQQRQHHQQHSSKSQMMTMMNNNQGGTILQDDAACGTTTTHINNNNNSAQINTTATNKSTSSSTCANNNNNNDEYISSALPPIINHRHGGGGGSSGGPLCITNMSRYVMKEKLGQGTYGVVFRCEDSHTGQSVAMKKISEQRPEEGVPSIAIREIALLREVQHPNVVALLNVLPRDRELMLIFEYVDQDLKKLLDSRITPFHGQKLKWIMYQLLQGMAACHAKRIVHRDLKPQNILVSKNEGVVKIADFGLARAFHVTLHSYTREVVTLWYRAPEILLGERHYRPAVDIWSLGCIMAELATKRALFPGDCEIHQLFLIFKTFGTPSEASWPGVTKLAQYNEGYPQWRPADLRNYVPGIDAHGLNLLKGMLQVDPLERISAPAALQHPWFDEIRDAYSQQFADYRNW